MKRRPASLSSIFVLGLTLALAQETEVPAEVLENLDFFRNYDMIKDLDALEEVHPEDHPLGMEQPDGESLQNDHLESLKISTETIETSTVAVQGSTETKRDRK